MHEEGASITKKQMSLDSLKAPSDDQSFSPPPVTVPCGRSMAVTIQVATVAGDPRKANEDTYLVHEVAGGLICAVFDGATSLKKIAAHDAIGMSGARFASHFLRDTLAKSSAWSESCLLDLNTELMKRVAGFDGIDILDPLTLPTSTATVVYIDFENHQLRIQHVSDSFCLLKKREKIPEFVTPDPYLGRDREHFARVQRIAAEHGVSNRVARGYPEVVERLHESLRNMQNRADGTGAGVVNGSPAMAQYIHRSVHSLDTIEAILLGSDGFPAPQMSLEKEEDRVALMDLVRSVGVLGAITHKKALEDGDPDWSTPRWKHSDDATGIYCSLTKFPDHS
jgi:hypothetical protein